MGDHGVILATKNGGSTWRAQASGTTEGLCGVAFSDAAHGWVVGDYGTILATTDGGATWHNQGSPTANDLCGVDFVDAAHGWVVGEGGAILATSDGGGPPVHPDYEVTPPAVPSRVRAGARIVSRGLVTPALAPGDRILISWEHFIGGRWDMVLALKPADSYWNQTTGHSTRYVVRMMFRRGKWRVRTTVGDDDFTVTSAYRKFTAY